MTQKTKVKLEDHPTVRAVRDRERTASPKILEHDDLRDLCLEAGADDVGFVSIDRPELDDQRDKILANFPYAKSLIALVFRMNRDNVRTPARSVSNLEFHHSGDHVNDTCRAIVTALQDKGVRAANPSMGFPMEMDAWPGDIWVLSHKPVAEAAGLGRMGIHRNVIHPKFGNFILLGTVIVGAPIDHESQPVDYNPCFECKLCVAACPVGAIGSDGSFNFSSCLTHNYREFLGGFNDWVDTVVESGNARDYRAEVRDSETTSVWQSLSFGPNYKAAYCMAVCPAGEDVIAPFLDDRRGFLKDVVEPLQKKEEPIYVIPKSDADYFVRKRYPHKEPRPVGNGVRSKSIANLLRDMPHMFQSGRAKALGIDAVYHFEFTGDESARATITIRAGKIEVAEGFVGNASLTMRADAQYWLGFLAGERFLPWGLITRRIRLKGNPRYLLLFGKCFPR